MAHPSGLEAASSKDLLLKTQRFLICELQENVHPELSLPVRVLWKISSLGMADGTLESPKLPAALLERSLKSVQRPSSLGFDCCHGWMG